MLRANACLKTFLSASLVSCALLVLSPLSAHADTLVRVDTDVGSFVLELYPDTAPATVTNFLSYVDSNAYDGTLIHRSVPNFVIQGGGFRFDPDTVMFPAIPKSDPVVNEFSRSNLRGTIAMAKFAGDPNSATSEWFINMQNNSANLDGQNGGFTVFGKVIGNGMTVVDAIGNLAIGAVDGNSTFGEIPYISARTNFLVDIDWVDLTMLSLSTSSKFESGLLSVALDAGTAGRALVDFKITQNTPATVITLEPSSVVFIGTTVDKMASFDTVAGELLIPELEVSGSIAYRNLRFQLTDPDSYSFTLVSFD